MMITFECQSCEFSKDVSSEMEGKKVKCPKCGAVSRVQVERKAIAKTISKKTLESNEEPGKPSDRIVFRKPVIKKTNSQSVSIFRSGYVESNLLPGETVVYNARLHWFIFVAPLGIFLIGLLIFSLLMSTGNDLLFVGLVVMMFTTIVSLAQLIESYITYQSAEFAITTKRVVMKTGFIRRRTLELLHNKIDALSVDQGIFGRLFGFGTVGVAVATEKQQFPFISDPLTFRKEVQARQAS